VNTNLPINQMIGLKCGIMATPTFQMYVNGKKVEEFKGANDRRLEQAFDQLEQLANPKHPHLFVRTRHLSFDNTSLQPVGFNTANIPVIFTKIKSYSDPKEGIELSATVLKLTSNPAFSKFETVLTEYYTKVTEKKEQNKTLALPEGTLKLLDELIASLPVDKVFPCFDILRLLVLYSDEATTHYVHNQSTLDLFQRFCTNQKDSKAPDAVVITLLRVACNLFFSETGKRFLTSRIQAMVELSNATLRHQNKSIRLSAATLTYNISLILNNSDKNESVIECICAIVHALDHEDDNENVYRMLMGLGKLLYCNDEGVSIVNTLEFNLDKHTKSNVVKVQEVANEVKSLLAATLTS